MAVNRQNTIVIGKNEKLRYRQTLQKQIMLKKQLDYLKETHSVLNNTDETLENPFSGESAKGVAND